MNAAEYAKQLHTTKAQIDDAFGEYERSIVEDADADRAMKQQMAAAYVTIRSTERKLTVGETEARVNQITGDIQHRARLAEGHKRAMRLLVDSRMQFLSALQSLASLSKSEMQLAKWEPSEVA